MRGVIITGLEDELKEFVRSAAWMGSLLFQIIGHGPNNQRLEFKLHFGNHCHCKTSCRKVIAVHVAFAHVSKALFAKGSQSLVDGRPWKSPIKEFVRSFRVSLLVPHGVSSVSNCRWI